MYIAGNDFLDETRNNRQTAKTQACASNNKTVRRGEVSLTLHGEKRNKHEVAGCCEKASCCTLDFDLQQTV